MTMINRRFHKRQTGLVNASITRVSDPVGGIMRLVYALWQASIFHSAHIRWGVRADDQRLENRLERRVQRSGRQPSGQQELELRPGRRRLGKRRTGNLYQLYSKFVPGRQRAPG